MKTKIILPIAIIVAAILIAFVFLFNQRSGLEDKTSVTQTPGMTKVTMTIFHTGYSTSAIRAKLGDTVEIDAVIESGTSAHKHGITISEYGINRLVTSENSNSPEIIKFTADKKGTFSIFCGTCRDGIYGTGHPDIRATLIVE